MGEEEAEMGLLDKLLKSFFAAKAAQECGELSAENITKEHEKIRARLDSMRATLNGEDGWFLKDRSSGGHNAR